MSPLIKSSCSYAIRQYICMPPIIRSIFCPSSGLLYRIDTACYHVYYATRHHVYMPPTSGQYVASHQANVLPSISSICCPPFRPYAARNHVYRPPSIISICRLPSCRYTSCQHVYMPPAIISICRHLSGLGLPML